MVIKTELYETLNNYRIFPRLFSLFYLYWLSRCLDWFMLVPDPSNAQGAFCAAVVAAGAAWFKFYCEGKK